jgi:hypothetical protein
MKKKVILLSIILFPSLIYLFFEMTKANFKKMAYFGPKTVNEKGDTNYYSVPNVRFTDKIIEKEVNDVDSVDGKEIITRSFKEDSVSIDTVNYPIYLILFIDAKYKSEGYKLAAIYDYLKYKAKELNDIPIFFVSDADKAVDDYDGSSEELSKGVELRGTFDSLKLNLETFHPLLVYYKNNREQFLATTYFKQKPYYVFDYFVALVDKKRHIRGYYDPTFNAEIKRMIADYKHLKIRDGYAQTLKQNDIEQNEKK